MKHLTKSTLVNLFAAKNIKAYRALGQNFLIDPNFLKSIPCLAQLTSNDYVLEIGAGPGLLTRYLAQTAKHVWAIEIDQRLVKIFQTLVGDLPNVELINQDILDSNRLQLNSMIQKHLLQKLGPNRSDASLKVVSNLPYAQATDIIINLLVSPLPIKSMLVMVQWEVAQKLKAVPKTTAYHVLSILLQNLAEVKVLKKVPPHIFWPKPKVYSALISIVPKKTTCSAATYPMLKRVVATVFRHRRKKILHALKELSPGYLDNQWRELLQETGLSPDQRASEISPQEYLALARKLQVVASCHAQF